MCNAVCTAEFPLCKCFHSAQGLTQPIIGNSFHPRDLYNVNKATKELSYLPYTGETQVIFTEYPNAVDIASRNVYLIPSLLHCLL